VRLQVLNQSDLPESVRLFEDDAALIAAWSALSGGADWSRAQLQRYGDAAGSAEAQEEALRAQRNRPVLHRFDRQGRALVGRAEYDPAYHAVLGRGLSVGQVSSWAWNWQGCAGAHVARGALAVMSYEAEPGTSCPMSMTYAAVPALAETESVGRAWIPRLLRGAYDGRDRPAAAKSAEGFGCTMGMSMTEKQGGSDVQANTTTATRVSAGGEEGWFALRGHKWFTSAPMSDAFLTLAQVPGEGLSCFLVPRWLENGDRNEGLQFQQLKNKLGDHSNASSEVHYDNALARLVGPPGRGVPTIISMVQATREDCALGSAGLMRKAVRLAAAHARSRSAFGRRLVDQPLMRTVLADLAAESELALLQALGISALTDDTHRFAAASLPKLALIAQMASEQNPARAARAAQTLALHPAPLHAPLPAHDLLPPLRRLLTAVVKLHVCKRAPALAAEALECLGGNGFVEDFGAAATFRQSPLNSIWEGSGNVQALDILRTCAKEPQALHALAALAADAAHTLREPAYAQVVARVASFATHLAKGTLAPADAQASARAFAHDLALLYQGWLVARFAPASLHGLADVFLRTRLSPAAAGVAGPNGAYGAWAPGVSSESVEALLSRA
jgi:putative acyl-CoA dehydrogenase